jgi:xylulokinase
MVPPILPRRIDVGGMPAPPLRRIDNLTKLRAMFLGIDIGTTSVKSILIDDEQSIIATAAAGLPLSRPRPGWSEQNPADWWQATADTLDALKSAHPASMAAVAAIGLSGQMHGATLLDAADRVLRPAILWNDGRAAQECVELERACPQAREIAGNIPMPGFTAPKLRWVRKHEPTLFDETRKVLLPKDYVRLLLTGESASDMSDASGTFWLDVGRRAWSQALLAATGLTREQMPRLVEGTEVSGRLRPALAARWGMRPGVVVAGGGGDNAASACGIGAIRPGAAFASIGTSGVLFVANAAFSPNTEGAVHAFCHAVPGTWHQMGVILSATDSLNWLARLLDAPAVELTGALGPVIAAPAPVLFLPYLSGERTPHNDVEVRGAFVGLGHDTDRGTLIQAVLEGVAFAFRDCLRVLGDAGTAVSRAAAVGGGARSRAWLAILANVLDRPLDIPEENEFGAAFGAARLGMAAALGGDPHPVMQPPRFEATIEPDPALVPRYTEAYARYQALYPATREIMRP